MNVVVGFALLFVVILLQNLKDKVDYLMKAEKLFVVDHHLIKVRGKTGGALWNLPFLVLTAVLSASIHQYINADSYVVMEAVAGNPGIDRAELEGVTLVAIQYTRLCVFSKKSCLLEPTASQVQQSETKPVLR